MRQIGSVVAALALAVSSALTQQPNEARAATTCILVPSGTTLTLAADCTTDGSIVNPNGFTLDGAGHTISAVDPAGDHFRGAVVRNGGAVAHVKNLRVTA